MSKITIVSRPDQHLLIDISGCLSFKEAIEQLSTTFLSTNQFWQGTIVDLNLGKLSLSKTQLAQIMALTKGVGVSAKNISAEDAETIVALKELEISLADALNKEVPSQISSVALLPIEAEYVVAVEPKSNEDNNETSGTGYKDGAEVTNSQDNTHQQMHRTMEQVIVFGDKQATEKSPEQAAIPISSAHEQTKLSANSKQSLYIKQTLRAGQAVSHKGDLIVIGDVNAGAEVYAEGDVTVWGSLRGIAHAGVGGNTKAEIRALRLQPIQIRIAHYIARSPDYPLSANFILSSSSFMAETAKLVDGKIRILRETFD